MLNILLPELKGFLWGTVGIKKTGTAHKFLEGFDVGFVHLKFRNRFEVSLRSLGTVVLVVQTEPDNELGTACLYIIEEVMDELCLQILARIEERR